MVDVVHVRFAVAIQMANKPQRCTRCLRPWPSASTMARANNSAAWPAHGFECQHQRRVGAARVTSNQPDFLIDPLPKGRPYDGCSCIEQGCGSERTQARAKVLDQRPADAEQPGRQQSGEATAQGRKRQSEQRHASAREVKAKSISHSAGS